MHDDEETHDDAVYSARYASDCNHPRDVRVYLGYGGGAFSLADCCKAGAPAHHAPQGAALVSPWLKPGVLRARLIKSDSRREIIKHVEDDQRPDRPGTQSAGCETET